MNTTLNFRQFRDAAKERYFKNKNLSHYFHSSIADYFLGIWGGGVPKPFKFTEIQRHRFNLLQAFYLWECTYNNYFKGLISRVKIARLTEKCRHNL